MLAPGVSRGGSVNCPSLSLPSYYGEFPYRLDEFRNRFDALLVAEELGRLNSW